MEDKIIDIEEMRRLIGCGYTEYSGIRINEIGEGYSLGEVDILPQHRNPLGAVHGGLIYCLGDVIGGAACRTVGYQPVTLSSSITYMKAILDDETIYARADVIKHGKTTAFVEVKIYNSKMDECARISANYYNLEGRV